MSKSFKYLPKSFPHFKAQKPGRLSKAVYSSLNGESFEALCEKSKNRNNGIKKNSSDTTPTFCVLQWIILIKYPSFKYSTILEHFFVLFFYLNNWDTIKGIERQRLVTQTQAMYEKRRVERIFANDSLRPIFLTLKLPEHFFIALHFFQR